MPSSFSASQLESIAHVLTQASPLEREVWQALLDIPFGETRTYQAIAQAVGRPSAVRAVASAIGRNPLAPLIPCHRVLRKDGTLGGYSASGGIATKKALLRAEGIDV
jgi:O-6-methylguanine DNA methyltransferase